jgi:chemotaxis protein MotB
LRIAVSLRSAGSGNQQLQAEYQRLEAQNVWLRQIARLQGAVRYTVNSDLLFPSGSWEMSSDRQRIIARLAQKLAPTQQNKLIVVGHTDNAPIKVALSRGGVTTNLDLSQERAESVISS